MKEHIIQTVPQWKYVLNAVSACTVTSVIEGSPVTLAHVPNGGSACFYANRPHVTVKTDAPFEVFPCAKDYNPLEQIQASAITTAPINAAVAEEQAKGSVVESLPDSPDAYTLKQGATVQLTEYTDTLQLTPSALDTAQEMRVLYSPAEARTTPLIAVPDGVTLHWAGDEEPTWEAGKDYVIQLLQTAPTRIEARLFNEPQGAKLPEISEKNLDALAGDFFNVWPEASEADILYLKSSPPRSTVLKARIIFAPLKTALLNAPNASVYAFFSGTLSNVWYDNLICRNFFFYCTGTTAVNHFLEYQHAEISGIYSFSHVDLLSSPKGIIGGFANERAVKEMRVDLPSYKVNLYIGATSSNFYKCVAQPLSAESVIYCLSHLRDLTLLPPDAEGNPISCAVKIGIDATLGVIDPVDSRWKSTHAGVIAAANEAELKNWAVAFDPAEP